MNHFLDQVANETIQSMGIETILGLVGVVLVIAGPAGSEE